MILAKLCALSDEEAAKEGKLKGNSAFKLSSLKLIARKRGMVSGTAKPEIITILRAPVLQEKELKKKIWMTRREMVLTNILKYSSKIGESDHEVSRCSAAFVSISNQNGPAKPDC